MLISSGESTATAVVFMAGLGLLAFWAWRARVARELRETGTEVMGVVAHTTRNKPLDGSGGATTHVKYTDDRGEEHSKLLLGRYAERGEPVAVWYDPEVPSRAVTSLDHLSMRYVLVSGSGAVLLGGIGVVLTIMQAIGPT